MFCQKFGEQTLSGLHQSFANADKFSTIITKQRALEYPCGRHVAGIYYKLEHDLSFKVSQSLTILVKKQSLLINSRNMSVRLHRMNMGPLFSVHSMPRFKNLV